ncbi:MAG: hypothetical protein JEY79_11050 [Pseudodesulfovibrio sp.]|nr:hypothetical protein [Pseudodesulfovibrio sp.]
MERYGNLHGNSGVTTYKINDDSICVEFKGGKTYLYTYASAGEENIEKMKELAREGRGLATFISQEVHDDSESKGC